MGIIYVTVMYCGCYDENNHVNIYVGLDYEIAKQKCMEYIYPNEGNEYGYIEYWENGNKIKEELIREYL